MKALYLRFDFFVPPPGLLIAAQLVRHGLDQPVNFGLLQTQPHLLRRLGEFSNIYVVLLRFLFYILRYFFKPTYPFVGDCAVGHPSYLLSP